MFGSIKQSIPVEQTVHGYAVKRMPLGAYLRALQTLQDFPRDVVAQMFPDKTDLGKALESLRSLNRDSMIDLLLKALTVVPERAVGLVAELTGIPADTLLNDPVIGLDGIAEIVNAWLEVNGAENFSRAASRSAKTIKALAATLKNGYKG